MNIGQQIIGRKNEIERLNKYAQSNQAEFIAIYGRRRVGKTYLINNVFRSRLAFSMTGIIEGNKHAQMQAFIDAMDLLGNHMECPANWHEAFRILRHFLIPRIKPGEPCIIFID